MSVLGLDRLIWVVSVLFGALSMYGAATQLRNPQFRAPCWVMVAGGFVLILAVALSLQLYILDWAVALIGCAAICAAAFWNGRRCGVINPIHHVVRIVFCAILVLGFYWS